MKRNSILFVVFVLGLVGQSFAQGGGDLVISPKRVVFEGKKQKQELFLINNGSETATYSVSFTQRNMKEDGGFEVIQTPDSGQLFADPYLRIFPRTVTLTPGEGQVIMLQCKRNSEMKAGEYRSHLYFRSEKDYTALGQKNPKLDSTQLSVQLVPIFGMSIPIIIRVGEVNMNTSLSDLKVEMHHDSAPMLKLTINRTGNISVYGNLTVEFVPERGKSREIAKSNGISVYTNINKRMVSVKLDELHGLSLKNGKLKVRYTSRPDDPKYIVYAEAELELKE